VTQPFLYAGSVDDAIIAVLRIHPEGLRYNELHRESGNKLGNSIWIKTFNARLKKFCRDGIVARDEHSRFKVFYKLNVPFEAEKYKSDIDQLISSYKEEQKAVLSIASAAREAVTDFREQRIKKAADEKNIPSPEAVESLEQTTEALIMQVIDNVAENTKFATYKALLFYGENPAWSQFAIDEAARMFRDLTLNLVNELGLTNSLTPTVLDRVKEKLMLKVYVPKIDSEATAKEHIDLTANQYRNIEEIFGEPPTIDLAVRLLESQVQRLDGATDRFAERDKVIFARIVNAYSKQDLPGANIFANELVEIRKIEKAVINSRLALEQIILKLRTVSVFDELEDRVAPGQAIAALVLAARVLSSIKNQMSFFPEVEGELGWIGNLLRGILLDVGQNSGLAIDFENANEDARRILDEAVKVAEQRIKEKFPEAPKLPRPKRHGAHVMTKRDKEKILKDVYEVLKKSMSGDDS
jgi:division protein CdvB (Snf7/Vps24/ESCRT-III family)